MREPKNQMLGTMEPPLMQLSVKVLNGWMDGTIQLQGLRYKAVQHVHYRQIKQYIVKSGN